MMVTEYPIFKQSIAKFQILQLAIIIVMCITSSNVTGQIRKIAPNEVSPDFVLKVFHYEKDTIKISDFRGKWIVLDIWSRACPPCIKTFPKLNEWQSKYSDKIQIILVGMDHHGNKTGIRHYYEGARVALDLKLPVVYDSIINEVFRVPYAPHLVLIDDKGLFRGMYDTKEMTIEKLLTIIEKRK